MGDYKIALCIKDYHVKLKWDNNYVLFKKDKEYKIISIGNIRLERGQEIICYTLEVDYELPIGHRETWSFDEKGFYEYFIGK